MKPEILQVIIESQGMLLAQHFEDVCKPLCYKASNPPDDCLSADEKFLCLAYDSRFEYATLIVLTPYTCSWEDDSGKAHCGFAWSNDTGRRIIQNETSPIVDWEKERILAFKQL